MTELRSFDRREGRNVFDVVARTYDAGRPAYPQQVFEILVTRCGLETATRVLEIGAGSGQATRRLLETDATIVAVEPSESLAAEMRRQLASSRLEVVVSPFEDANLPEASFDLAVSATAFHWLDVHRGLDIVHRTLRHGGWIALWWNVFGDPELPDPFHDATQSLLSGLAPSPAVGGEIPFALDVTARRRELEQHGFPDVGVEVIAWDLILTAEQTRRLYATYSNLLRLQPDKREPILDGIEQIARDEFDDRVVRKMLTPVYTARRR